MFKPTTFYPARLTTATGDFSLFTNECETAHQAKAEVQKLIDSNCFGTATHVVAGFAYFNKGNEIVYVFPKKEDIKKSLVAIKKMVATGATRQYAKLKELKKSAVFALEFLNNKELANKVKGASTFKELGLLLNE